MEFFGIGLPEMLVILVLILIVVGPQRLPEMAAQIARFIREFRRYTSQLSRDIGDALEDIEKEYTDVQEEWKEVSDTVRRETKAIEAEISDAAGEASAALEERRDVGAPKSPPEKTDDQAISVENAAERRAAGSGSTEATPPVEQERPSGQENN